MLYDIDKRTTILLFRRTIALLALAATTANMATAAEFIPLGTLPGHSSSIAYGVSDDGMVVAGQSYCPSCAITTYIQTFRWTDATGMVAVEPLEGMPFFRGYRNGQQPLSGDGSTIVGGGANLETSRSEAFMNTVDGGTMGLGLGGTTERGTGTRGIDVSFDGGAVVGTIDHNSHLEAFRWTADGGLQGLGQLPGYSSSVATDISDDGGAVVGLNSVINGAQYEIFHWTEASGMTAPGLVVPNLPSVTPVAVVSNSGDAIAGNDYVTSATDLEAFVWTEETGQVGLGWLPGTSNSQVRDMTPDGRLIVGRSGADNQSRPFVWTAENGMEDFMAVLREEHGLASALRGWNLGSIQSVSPNGQFFAGWSTGAQSPTGDPAAWLVRLDAPWGTTSVPEPTAALALLALVPLAVWRRGRAVV